ncbi:TolC family protein [Methylobacillus pratensis]
MRTTYVVICFTLLWLCCKPAQAGAMEAGQSLTLSQALSLVDESNPELAIAIREQEALQGGRLQAGYYPNPTIATAVEATRNAAQRTAIQLNQPIELGNKRQARMEAAEKRLTSAALGRKAKAAEIHAAVTSSFYMLLAAQEKLKLAQSMLELATHAREATAKRVDAGQISPVEEAKAAVAEAGIEIEVAQAESNVLSARRKLSALWGGSSNEYAITASGDLEMLAGVPEPALLGRHVEHAPSVELAKMEIEVRQALTSIERSKQTPDLVVSVGAQRNEEIGANQALLGVTIPIPVFNRNQGNVLEAIKRTDQAQDVLNALRISLAAQLGSEHAQFSAALKAVQTLKGTILPRAESAFHAARTGFDHGKFSYLEVLDAQRTLFQSQNQYLSALASAHEASASIERILGEPIASIVNGHQE